MLPNACSHRRMRLSTNVVDLARRVRHRARAIGRPILLAMLVAAALTFGSVGSARGEDKNIYPTNHATTPWTFQEVNHFLDETACASYEPYPIGQTCPAAGDTIIFNGHADGSIGDYVPPTEPTSQSYILKTDNIDITCNNARFKGNNASAPVLFRTYSGGHIISGCIFDAGPSINAQGIVSHSGFDPTHSITLTGNWFYGFDKGSVWDNITNQEDNSEPAIIIIGNYFKDNQIGSQFAKSTQRGVNELTMFGIFHNNFLEGIGAIGYEPVAYPGVQGTASTSWIAPGIDQFDGNVFLNSPDGVPLSPEAYGASSPPRLRSRDDPDNNGEFQIALNVVPCPPNPEQGSVCYQGPLQEWYGGGNFTENPLLNWARRPMPGSPAIPRKAGAFTPVYDNGVREGDWQVTQAEDFEGEKGFRTAFYQSYVLNNLSPSLQNIHDINGDGKVNWYDFSNTREGGFVQACTNCSGAELESILKADIVASGIPTLSEWGTLTMGLLLLTGGTLVYRRYGGPGELAFCCRRVVP